LTYSCQIWYHYYKPYYYYYYYFWLLFKQSIFQISLQVIRKVSQRGTFEIADAVFYKPDALPVIRPKVIVKDDIHKFIHK